MTEETKSIGLEFGVTGIEDQSFSVSTRQNVKKRIENIVYLEQPPNDAVLLSYVGSKELTPENNLFVADRSDQLYANSRAGTIGEFISEVYPVSVQNRNFLVTQEFIEAESQSVPLYYRHDLEESIVPESVRILDKDSILVDESSYKLVTEYIYDEDTGVSTGVVSHYSLFNSLENVVREADDYEVYYVQYTDQTDTGSVVRTVLLNNEKAYRKAELEDIWHVSLDLKPWARAYKLSSSLSLSLPKSAKLAVLYEEQKRIRVSLLSSLKDTVPWYPRVTNGTFSSRYNNVSVPYDVPEFGSQSFNPYEPYKNAINVSCSRLAASFIWLPNEEIVFGDLFSELFIVIADNTGTVIHALTTDSSKVSSDYIHSDGEKVYDSDGETIKWNSSLLLGLDRWSGIVHVDIDLQEHYVIQASYTYREIYFTITSLNMNPIFDSEARSQIRSIYLVPESIENGNLGVQTSSIQWAKINSAGTIEEVSQDSSGGNEDLDFDTQIKTDDGYAIKGALGLYYKRRAETTTTSSFWVDTSAVVSVDSTVSFPKTGWIRMLDTFNRYRYMKYEEKTSTTLTLSSSSFHVPGRSPTIAENTEIQLVNFVDERCVGSIRSYTEEATLTGATYPSVSSQYFVLGELSINPAHSVNDLTFIDVRRDGGGIVPDKYEEAKLLNPEVQWTNTDEKYDGQVYPGKGTTIVKLPISL
ncbi:MAG: hypothetical protein DRH90_23535, partial [Deltaproteobacteria bacterium]